MCVVLTSCECVLKFQIKHFVPLLCKRVYAIVYDALFVMFSNPHFIIAVAADLNVASFALKNVFVQKCGLDFSE